MKKYASATEIAEMLGKTRQSVEYTAKKESWEFQYVKGKGGKQGKKKEYALPAYLLSEIAANTPLEAEKPAPVSKQSNALTVKSTQKPSQLATWQRDCAVARMGICQEVLKLSQTMTKTKAVKQFIANVKEAQEKEHNDALLVRVANANAKNGKVGKAKVSERTLWNWLKAHDVALQADGTSVVAALAPKAPAIQMPEWAPLFLKLWGQPSKPNMTDVLEELCVQLPESMQAPSYQQARYFLLAHLGNVAREEGRLGARKLKEIKPFVRRDTSMLMPADIYTADGHTFDAEVAHPATGKPFRPEITTVMDVATRMVVGFSIDLAESRWAVLDALRSSAINYSIPAIFYVDNGSGYKNDMMQAEGRGLMSRLGIDMRHSIGYNSQARGGIERIHQTLWIKLAKKLPTYMGADMDAEASQKAFKKTRKDIVQFKKSKLLIGWDEFMQACTGMVTDYNAKGHSSLPKRTDKAVGIRRHISPNEYWAEFVDQGFEAVPINDYEKEDLFRPYAERKCRRGEIELFGNRYFSNDLEQYHGDTVYVGYDIHDPDKVWVRDVDGHLLAVATFESNKTAFYAQPVIEQAREKRAKGKLRRLATKQADALEELSATDRLKHVDSVRLPEVKVTQAQQRMAQQLLEADAQAERDALIAEEEKRKRLEAKARFSETVAVQADTGSKREFTLYDFGDNEPLAEPTKKVTPLAPEVVEQVETVDNKYVQWLEIDQDIKDGKDVSQEDRDFWELFPSSKKFALLKQQHDADQKTHSSVSAFQGQ